MKAIEDYQKALDEIWNVITALPKFTQECGCGELDVDETFDTIDYTGDYPEVRRWCLSCGGLVNV